MDTDSGYCHPWVPSPNFELYDLNIDCFRLIARLLSNKDRRHLSQACRRFRTQMGKELEPWAQSSNQDELSVLRRRMEVLDIRKPVELVYVSIENGACTIEVSDMQQQSMGPFMVIKRETPSVAECPEDFNSNLMRRKKIDTIDHFSTSTVILNHIFSYTSCNSLSVYIDCQSISEELHTMMTRLYSICPTHCRCVITVTVQGTTTIYDAQKTIGEFCRLSNLGSTLTFQVSYRESSENAIFVVEKIGKAIENVNEVQDESPKFGNETKLDRDSVQISKIRASYKVLSD